MTTTRLPDGVFDVDRAVERADDLRSLASHRWFWTACEDNPLRVSPSDYAEGLGYYSAGHISRYANAWLIRDKFEGADFSSDTLRLAPWADERQQRAWKESREQNISITTWESRLYGKRKTAEDDIPAEASTEADKLEVLVRRVVIEVIGEHSKG